MSVPASPPPSVVAGAEAIVLRARRFFVALWDIAKRVWDSSGEDRVFFLAGGIAFNILLATIPFVLLLISGMTYLLGLSPDASRSEVVALVERFLPPQSDSADESLHRLIGDIVAARASVGAYGAPIYVWLSTRLFGSLRTVLADIFDIDIDRGIMSGKWFDVRITVYSTVLLVAWVALSLYLAVARSRGLNFMMEAGLGEQAMGVVAYVSGRILAFAFVVAIFLSLYKYLPNRRIRWPQAFVGALASGVLLELARNVWTAYTSSFDPGSVYSGTLYALVSVVFWVYYAALIFILGGEVAQAHELRRVRQRQRARFDA